MNYKIAIHHNDEGISVSVPALPVAGPKVTPRKRLCPTSKMRFAIT